MPIPASFTGTPVLGFSSPTSFYVGIGGSTYPIRGLGWSVKDEPKFSTLKATSAAGRDIRVPLYQNPLHNFQLVFNFLENDPALNLSGNPDTDFRLLYSFYSAVTGAAGDFLYQPRESSVTGQALLLPDANGYTELVYSLGPFFNESVQELNGANPTIFNGATNITSSCTFHSPDSVAPYSGITFTTTTSPLTSLTANFSLYYRCHWDKDQYSFEEFMYRLFKTGVGFNQIRI